MAYQIDVDGAGVKHIIGRGADGGETPDYNLLDSKPVINKAGTPVVLSTLSDGIYKIKGSWSMTPGGAEFAADGDELFYVKNGAEVCSVVKSGATGDLLIRLPNGGGDGDVIYSNAGDGGAPVWE